MTLKTVRVPDAMALPFIKAEEIVSRYFRDRRHDPERGTIEIEGERYVLVRAASLSVEFFTLVRDLYGVGREAEAEDFARNILFDLAHAIGKSDAANFHAKMQLEDPIARLSAGPIHFAHSGWAFVDIFPESRPAPNDDYYLVYDHPYSFESDAWLRARRTRDFPVCIMNAGYSSGWCEESFGVVLVASEILCRARGDESCRFIMAPPSRIEERVKRYLAGRSELATRATTYQIPDFFARKRMEEELRRAHAELEQRVLERTAELRRSNEALRQQIAERERVEKELRQSQKLEAIGRLSGGIAHDFNNLLGIVMSRGAMVLTQLPKDDALRAEVEQILQAGERAASLTQRLLAFSRTQVLRREVLDLNRVVTELGRLIEPLVGEDVELVSKLGAGIFVLGDRGQIEQVIMNLVVNARDAMPGGGAVTIETSAVELDASSPLGLASGSYVLLAVADTGVGMDDATLARIFEPFFTTKEHGKGTGLGLSTAYGIVRQSGGTISVTSAPGAGSRFSIFLPRIDPATVAASARAIGEPPRGTETILLVEDEQCLRGALKAVLTNLGYRVLDAAGAAEALAIAEKLPEPIDLLLTDVIMPKTSGPELVERFRAVRSATPVLYMSGYASERILRMGALEREPFIQKPFAPDQLAHAVREALAAKR